VLTGFIANVFLGPRAKAPEEVAPDDPRRAIVEVRRLLDEQEGRNEEIRARLDQLERALGPTPSSSQSTAS
jgi:hypothetical protein